MEIQSKFATFSLNQDDRGHISLMPMRPKIVVVSGLPRSGTSMVMQMLAAGGAPLLADFARPADEDNPQGYFEFEPVKRLRLHHGWMAEAAGKAVKVVSPLLPDLPTGFDYRVVLIERNLDEVLASQRAMLHRIGQPGSTLSDQALLDAFERQQMLLETTLATRRDFSVLRLEFHRLLANPAHEANELKQFVLPIWPNNPLDRVAMAASVDPNRPRHRASA